MLLCQTNLGCTGVTFVTMRVQFGNVSVARLAQMVAFSGRQFEPRKGEVCEYPHWRRFWFLSSSTEVLVVEVGHLKMQDKDMLWYSYSQNL